MFGIRHHRGISTYVLYLAIGSCLNTPRPAATCLGTTFHSYTYVPHLLADTCVFHWYWTATTCTSFGGLLNHCICFYSMLTAMKHVLNIFFARKIGRIPIQQLTPTLLSNGLHTLVHGEGYSFLPIFSVATILGHYLLTGKTWASTPSGVDGSKGRAKMNQTGLVWLCGM